MLFRTVSLDILPQSIEILRMIANCPSLACHVQTLVVSTNLLPPCAYLQFKRRICYQESLRSAQLEMPSLYPSWIRNMHRQSNVRRRYKRYCYYLDRQIEILASLQLTIAKLLQLKNLEFRVLNDADESRRWLTFSHEVFGNDSFDLDSGTIVTFNNGSHLCVTHSLLSGMYHHLTSLEIDYVSCSCWYYEHYTEVWRHLRHLKICAEQGSTVKEICFVRAGLRRMLLNIGLIEFLHLEITPSCGYLSRTNFGEVFADIQLTSLQYLTIHTGKISLPDLLGVFQLHKGILRLFNVTDLHLIDDQWESVFTLLKDSLHDCVAIFEGVTDGDGWSIRAVVPFGNALKVKQAS